MLGLGGGVCLFSTLHTIFWIKCEKEKERIKEKKKRTERDKYRGRKGMLTNTLKKIVLRDTEENHLPLDTVFDHYVRFGKRAFEETIYPTKTLADIILPRGPESAAIDLIAMGVWDDIRARKDEQVKILKQGIAALQVSSGGLSVAGSVGTMPGHFSPLRSYSPTRPYVSKNRITIGEADLENFYGSVSS